MIFCEKWQITIHPFTIPDCYMYETAAYGQLCYHMLKEYIPPPPVLPPELLPPPGKKENGCINIRLCFHMINGTGFALANVQ